MSRPYGDPEPDLTALEARLIVERDEARAEVERLNSDLNEYLAYTFVICQVSPQHKILVDDGEGNVYACPACENERLRAGVDRLQKQREKFRSDVEGMPNTIISRRAKRHVLAALDGAR